MSTPHYAHQLTDNELRAIGLIAQEWALFESLIHRIITKFLGAEEHKGDMVGVAMGSKLSIEFTSAIGYTVFTPDDAEAFQKLMERSGKLASKRNDAVHLVWVRSDEDPTKLSPVGLKVRHTIKIATGDTSYQAFESLAQEIYYLGCEIAAFLRKRDLWPPIEGEQPPSNH